MIVPKIGEFEGEGHSGPGHRKGTRFFDVRKQVHVGVEWRLPILRWTEEKDSAGIFRKQCSENLDENQ
jgi:hypothetical protein